MWVEHHTHSHAPREGHGLEEEEGEHAEPQNDDAGAKVAKGVVVDAVVARADGRARVLLPGRHALLVPREALAGVGLLFGWKRRVRRDNLSSSIDDGPRGGVHVNHPPPMPSRIYVHRSWRPWRGRPPPPSALRGPAPPSWPACSAGERQRRTRKWPPACMDGWCGVDVGWVRSVVVGMGVYNIGTCR